MKGRPLDENALLAANRRFPEAQFAIRRLMHGSEDFCDMCLELAEAEAALANVAELPADLRAIRRTEWQDLVDRLVAEIGGELSKSEEWASLRSR